MQQPYADRGGRKQIPELEKAVINSIRTLKNNPAHC